jgi:hypothetical protein
MRSGTAKDRRSVIISLPRKLMHLAKKRPLKMNSKSKA